jgi:hypothetical protein
LVVDNKRRLDTFGTTSQHDVWHASGTHASEFVRSFRKDKPSVELMKLQAENKNIQAFIDINIYIYMIIYIYIIIYI